MKFLGLEVSIRKAAAPSPAYPSSYLYDRGWLPVVREPYAGAWQQNRPLIAANPMQNSTLYRCVTMPAADIAKMRLKLMMEVGNISKETTSPSFTPVMAKPNRFQTRIQFFESWIISKLRTGNTFILKERDNRNVVVAMYVLDPYRVKILVASDGSVYYELNTDQLSGVFTDRVVVPSDEIMHDRMNCLFHPLFGMSPLYSTTQAAIAGLSMNEFSARFFTNAARPSGVLSAPSDIPQAVADRLKAHWDQQYSQANAGTVAVLGSGLKFEAMQQNAVDSQLIEQLKHTDESICAAFGIPAFMVGVKDPPNYNNAELLDLQYYKSCLQSLIEHIETILTEGLSLDNVGYCAEFDLKGLFRMDSQTQITMLSQAVDKGIMTHNEARELLNLPPEPGGDVLMAQQQMFTLEALANRSTAPALPAAPAPGAPPAPDGQHQPTPEPPPPQKINPQALITALRKEFDCAA
jgi:HK97 family phage portal protein